LRWRRDRDDGRWTWTWTQAWSREKGDGLGDGLGDGEGRWRREMEKGDGAREMEQGDRGCLHSVPNVSTRVVYATRHCRQVVVSTKATTAWGRSLRNQSNSSRLHTRRSTSVSALRLTTRRASGPCRSTFCTQPQSHSNQAKTTGVGMGGGPEGETRRTTKASVPAASQSEHVGMPIAG
jgi:hypothetical protein